jgi:hypothetical protein
LALLPGSNATFAGLSEIFSHPGPTPALLLEGCDLDTDLLFWQSLSCATYASLAGEIAFGLGREDWADQLIWLVDRLDPAVRVAWPAHALPTGPEGSENR